MIGMAEILAAGTAEVRVVRTAADQDGRMETDQGIRMTEIQVVTDITEIAKLRLAINPNEPPSGRNICRN
jgi:hypothetical protein